MALYEWFGKYAKTKISLFEALDGFNNERHPIGVQLSNDSIELGKKVVLEKNERSHLSNEYIRSPYNPQ